MVNKVSFVIPVYNEEQNLAALVTEIFQVMEKLSHPFEILFIDDGSIDRSLQILKELAATRSQIKYLSLAQRCGQSAALGCGFQAASGDVIVTMDADLQNDPADLEHMFKFYGDYDMVTGWRFNRQDSWSKKIGSKIGNGFRNWLTYEQIHDTGCSLKIMRADMLKQIRLFKGLHRFLPTLMRLEGARVIEVKVNHRPRRHGESKYSNWRRGIEGFSDVLAVRWMIKRSTPVQIKERHVEN